MTARCGLRILALFACLASVFVLLSGCVLPIPLYKSEATPNVVPHIPADLQSSENEFLVLAHYGEAAFSIGTHWIDKPAFVKGDALASVQGKFKKFSSSQVVALVGLPAGYEAAIFGVPVTRKRTQLLQTLCVIAPDGRSITLTSPGANDWTSSRVAPLTAQRRNAIIAALRDGSEKPFEKIDGPCGVYGALHWPREERDRVLDFLARLPSLESQQVSKQLVNALQKPLAGSTNLPTGDAMLVASLRWRNQRVVEVPVFLTSGEFQALSEATGTLTGAEIIQLFPAYDSASHALEGLYVERLCAISREGRLLWWSEEKRAWRTPVVRPSPQWREDFNAVLKGNESQGWAQDCAPPPPLAWSDDEKSRIADFLQQLPVWDRPRPSDLLAMTAASSGAGAGFPTQATEVLVLVHVHVGWKDKHAGHPVTPIFYRTANWPSLIEAISSMSVDEVLTLSVDIPQAGLPDPERISGVGVCVIAADGQIVALETVNRAAWRELERTQVTSEWRLDALIVAREENREGFRDAHLCFPTVIAADSTAETRDRLTRFLEAIPVKEAERARP